MKMKSLEQLLVHWGRVSEEVLKRSTVWRGVGRVRSTYSPSRVEGNDGEDRGSVVSEGLKVHQVFGSDPVNVYSFGRGPNGDWGYYDKDGNRMKW